MAMEEKANTCSVAASSGRKKSMQNKHHASLEISNNATTRDCANLYASPTTVKCALENHCVPCAYKVGCFDVALDQEFCRKCPNQRPENCPRARTTVMNDMATGNKKRRRQPPHVKKMCPVDQKEGFQIDNNNSEFVLGFQPGMRVLTCGDGDFSFSLALARRFRSSTKLLIDLVATSYEAKHTLRRVYPNFDETVEELEMLGVQVCYEVDATRLYESLPFSAMKGSSDGSNHKNLESTVLPFHRICWNFPCTAIERGQDGQNREMEQNKDLVRQFVQQHFADAVKDSCLLHPTEGEIHICHKTKPPFDQWRLELVALDGENTKTKICFAGRIVLDRFLIPPYTPRKALDRKSFPCHDACFYVFRRLHQINNTSDESNDTDGLQFLPTLPRRSMMSKSSTPDCTAIPVTVDLISSIRMKLLCSSRKEVAVSKTKMKARKRGRIN